MIHHIWFIMIASSVVYGCVHGAGGQLLEAALLGSGKALSLTVELCGGYLFFCGLMEIAKASGAQRGLQRLLSPLLQKLMPHVQTPEARGAIALNLAMNVLGMGNAATPMGLEAMRRMDTERALHPPVKHDMEMLLILNATSLQLLPTTVLTLRAAAGSANVNAILLPTIACTALSTLTGVAAGLVCRRWEERKHAG